MRSILLILALLVAATAEIVSYEGFKVYQLHPADQQQLDIITSFISNKHFDFWTTPRLIDLPTTVMVDPQAQNAFQNTMDEANVSYKVLIENVERNVQSERMRQDAAVRVPTGKISFTEYHRYDAIQEYVLELAQNYPDFVSIEIPQASFEGRPLRLVKIGTGGSDKPIILIEAGIHAREWIAPALALYIIQELVENEDNRDLIENVDWYIIPVLNPDGYEYTHTTNRLWRKTRSPNWESDCIGTDANRNFAYQWMTIGASSDPCSETFAGFTYFDQFETMGLRNVVEEYQIYGDRVKLFLGLHSYGQYLLYPWGATRDLPDNVEELHSLAVDVEAAIAAVRDTRYTIGSSANVLYYLSGGSRDWVMGAAGVGLSYTIELPGGGNYGFDLPPTSILEVCVETFQGIKVYHQYIEKNFASQELSNK